MSRSPQERRRRMASALLLAAAIVPAAALPAAALPAAASAKATPSSAKAAYQRADKAVVAAAKSVARCQGHATTPPKRCAAKNAKLQSAGLKLSAAQRRLPKRVARASAAATSTLTAPALSATGTKLSWTKVGRVTTYVLVAKQSGQADRYSVVSGTSTTPAAVAGATVAYSVRTAVTGSAWSKTLSIAYPSAAQPAPADPRQAAPVMKVSGTTISWAQVADVTSYEFVTKVPGLEDRYELIDGTKITPPAHPGKTVRYGLRTNVTGSKYATEVSIAWPASSSTTPTTTTPSTTAPATSPAPPSTSTGDAAAPTTDATAPAPSTRALEVGLVAGSAIQWEQQFIQPLGAKHVRMEFDINTSVATMTPIIASYAKAGIRPVLLATFNGRVPTDAEAQKLGAWAKAFGPNGTARATDWKAGTAVTEIEYGNESNQPWQYTQLRSDDNWPNSSFYATLAQQYALTFKTASTTIKANNNGVGLLAIADTPGRWATWQDGVFKAVPNFGSYVGGWVVHPYGPGWQLAIDDAMSKAAAHGASNAIPIYATEMGLSTDNGRCVSDNYGWDRCLTYDQAATTLHSTISAMRARYGGRLAAIYLYSARDLSASGTSTDRESYFGAVHSDNTTKGAFTTEVKAQLAASA